MPFTLRSCENETKAKMGVVECVTHKLIEPFQVLYEKEGESVAQFKFTVLLMPNGPHKITGLPLDLDIVESEKSIEDLDIQVSGAGGKNRHVAVMVLSPDVAFPVHEVMMRS